MQNPRNNGFLCRKHDTPANRKTQHKQVVTNENKKTNIIFIYINLRWITEVLIIFSMIETERQQLETKQESLSENGIG
jgi:hypothetical protein